MYYTFDFYIVQDSKEEKLGKEKDIKKKKWGNKEGPKSE